MSLQTYIDRGKSYLISATGSDFFRAVGQNWLQPIPQGENRGRTWSEVVVKDSNGVPTRRHLHNRTNDLYKADSNGWTLLKTIGIAYTGQYYFGAALTRHVGSGLFKTAKSLKGMWESYQVLKGQEGFNFRTFAEGEFSNFNAAIGEFKQAGKDLVGFGLFYFNPEPFGLPIRAIATTVAIGYAAYAPLNVRVQLNRFESWWRPENVKPLTDREIEQLSIWGTVEHLSDGSFSLSRIFNMHRIKEGNPPESRGTFLQRDVRELPSTDLAANQRPAGETDPRLVAFADKWAGYQPPQLGKTLSPEAVAIHEVYQRELAEVTREEQPPKKKKEE